MAGLPDDELVGLMRAARRQTSWSQSVELAAVAELSRRRHDEERGLASRGMWTSEIHEVVTAEVSLALTLTGTAAAGWVCLGEQITEDLPALGTALSTGTLDLDRVRVIADALRGVERDLAAKVVADVLGELWG